MNAASHAAAAVNNIPAITETINFKAALIASSQFPFILSNIRPVPVPIIDFCITSMTPSPKTNIKSTTGSNNFPPNAETPAAARAFGGNAKLNIVKHIQSVIINLNQKFFSIKNFIIILLLNNYFLFLIQLIYLN